MVRSDARRNIDRIVDVAIGVLADRPLATLGDIADASGLHRATLHRHFTGREDLLRAIYARAADEAEAALWAAGPEDGRVEDALRRMLVVSMELSDRYRIVAGTTDPEFSAHRERVMRPLTAMFEYGRSTGALRRDLPLRWMLLSWRAVMLAAVEACADGELSEQDAADAAATMLLAGLRDPGPPPSVAAPGQ